VAAAADERGDAGLEADFRGVGDGNAELDITESVHGQNLSFRDGIADEPFRDRQHDQIRDVDFRSGRGQFRVPGQMRGDRHEDIAAVKGRRDVGQPQLAVGQAERTRRAARCRHGPGQQAVVGADEHRLARRHRHGPPGRAHAGIDHRHVHGRRQVGHGLGQHGRAAPDVAGRDLVGHVDDAGVRRDPGGHAMARGDEPVFEPVVGEEAEVAETGHER
jgi:hypothetical protein